MTISIDGCLFTFGARHRLIARRAFIAANSLLHGIGGLPASYDAERSRRHARPIVAFCLPRFTFIECQDYAATSHTLKEPHSTSPDT